MLSVCLSMCPAQLVNYNHCTTTTRLTKGKRNKMIRSNSLLNYENTDIVRWNSSPSSLLRWFIVGVECKLKVGGWNEGVVQYEGSLVELGWGLN